MSDETKVSCPSCGSKRLILWFQDSRKCVYCRHVFFPRPVKKPKPKEPTP